eukprot:1066280-Karenia_brevis.AAC.1
MTWMDTVPTWTTWMDDLHLLDDLDGRPSPLGLPGWTTSTTLTTWMDNLHRLDYLDGQPS